MMKSVLKQILVVSMVIALTACGNGGSDSIDVEESAKKVEDNGLTKDINDLVPEDILEKIIALGMPIHKGAKPPKMEGIYEVSPDILIATNIPSDSIGHRFDDLHIKFYNQNNKNLTIKIDYQQDKSESGHGIGSFIVGTDNQFTIFSKIDGVNWGKKSVSVQIYSGTITEEGIEDYYNALFMIDDKGDAKNILIENGQGRVFYDSDGMSKSINSIKFKSLKRLNKPIGALNNMASSNIEN